jgi:cadmium resistance protein CadD (predicted permease)
MPVISLIGIGVVAFVTTNLDDMVVLLAFLADPACSPAAVVLGQFLGFSGIVVMSFGAALAARRIDPTWIGLLGLIPLTIGVRRLVQIRRPARPAGAAPVLSHWQALTVAGVTVANGGDNFGLYTPMFAAGTFASSAILVVVFYLMLALWCGLAWSLVRHPVVAACIRRRARLVVPLLYIALGLWVLAKSRFGLM